MGGSSDCSEAAQRCGFRSRGPHPASLPPRACGRPGCVACTVRRTSPPPALREWPACRAAELLGRASLSARRVLDGRIPGACITVRSVALTSGGSPAQCPAASALSQSLKPTSLAPKLPRTWRSARTADPKDRREGKIAEMTRTQREWTMLLHMSHSLHPARKQLSKTCLLRRKMQTRRVFIKSCG